MGMYMQRFHCVELLSEKFEISSYPTRWGAAKRCHYLNKLSPNERWTVKKYEVRYVSNYIKQALILKRKEAK